MGRGDVSWPGADGVEIHAVENLGGVLRELSAELKGQAPPQMGHQVIAWVPCFLVNGLPADLSPPPRAGIPDGEKRDAAINRRPKSQRA